MQIPIYQLDTFASARFRGNPAAVCPLEQWPAEETMQAVAAENNVSETVFFAPEGDGFQVRWFTPAREVGVGSHGTLAAGYVAARELGAEPRAVRLDSVLGELTVTVDGDRCSVTLPPEPPTPVEGLGVLEQVGHALGRVPWEVLDGRYLMAVYDDEDDVRGMGPEMDLVIGLGRMGVVVTAPSRGDDDVICRVFAPAAGVPEDPVTSSAFRLLGPYWAERLKRNAFTARQVSARGGKIECRLADDGGVEVAGRVVKYLEGRIEV